MRNRIFSTIFFVAASTNIASAELPSGERTVRLHANNDEAIQVARVLIADGGRYDIVWDDAKFSDYFLAMRPFKCLESEEKLWCRVAYPYAIDRRIEPGDLVDLEYDLMFVWKNANEYGIDLWNGVYYRIEPDGDRLVGTMHDLDLNLLASPPEDGNLRPVSDGDLEEADADSHWLPRMTIE